MKKLLLVAALAAAPAFADVGYSYFDLSYHIGGDLEAGGGSIDTDGYTLKGSFAIDESLFVQLDYSSLSTDPTAIEIDGYALSFGWHGEMAYARAGYESGELDICAVLAPPCSVDDSGFTVDFGLRSMVADNVELNGHLGYSDLGDLETYTNYGFGAVVSINEDAGVSFNYEFRAGDSFDINTIGLGFRYDFD